MGSRPPWAGVVGSARRKDDGTTEHAEHADGGGALLGQDEAFDLKPGLAEGEQQTEMQAGGLQIIQALSAMDVETASQALPSSCTQRPFIHLPHESSSQPMEHRLRAPNDSSGQQVNPALGAICPRVQRVLWFHFPFLTAGTTFRIR